MQKKQVIEKTGEWTEWNIIPSGYLLVGGLEHVIFPYIGNNNPN